MPRYMGGVFWGFLFGDYFFQSLMRAVHDVGKKLFRKILWINGLSYIRKHLPIPETVDGFYCLHLRSSTATA